MPPVVTLVKGWLSELGLLRVDGMALIEVIEHLDPPELAMVGTVLLGTCKPMKLLVTTPNYEYNLNFVAPTDEYLKAQGPADRGLLIPKNVDYRNDDHRFEWTRLEFKEWASQLAEAHGYDLELRGVGGNPLDDVVEHGEWRGGGPMTQAAIFTKREQGAHEQEAIAPEATAAVPPGVEALDVVWRSDGAPAVTTVAAT